MKKILVLALALTLVLTSCGKFDDRAQWYNAASRMTALTIFGADNLFDTSLATAANKKLALQALDANWNIDSQEDFEQRFSDLMTGFYNRNIFNSYYSMLERTEEEKQAEASRLRNPDKLLSYWNAILELCAEDERTALAFDYVSAIDLAGLGYIAGYINKAKAEEYANMAALKLQSTFDSWDEMMQNYLFGYQYWNDDFPFAESTKTAKVIELYNSKSSSYTIDWNMNLLTAGQTAAA